MPPAQGGQIGVSFVLDLLGNFAFFRRIVLWGISERICAMQFKRARRLSSERRIYQGACLLSVAFTIMSATFEISSQYLKDFEIHWAELPLPQGIVDPRQKSSFLFFLAHLKPDLDEDYSVVDYGFLKMRQRSRNRL